MPDCPACGGRVEFEDGCPVSDGDAQIDRTERDAVSVFGSMPGPYRDIAERRAGADGCVIVELEGELTGNAMPMPVRCSCAPRRSSRHCRSTTPHSRRSGSGRHADHRLRHPWLGGAAIAQEVADDHKARCSRLRAARGGCARPCAQRADRGRHAKRLVKEGGALRVADAEATIPVIARLLESARASGMRVVFSQDTHDDGDPEWEIWPEHARRGGWGWRIVDELAPRDGELVIPKVRYDAFYGTHLEHFLRLWGVDTVVVCGTVANICVHYTAASAALRWFDVVIPRDATSALEPFDLASSLRQTAFLFAGKVTTADALRLRPAATA